MATRLARLYGATAFTAALLASTAAMPEALPKPPLRIAEVIAVTVKGCALIGLASTPDQIAKFRNETRSMEWRGPCRNGLAHGLGVLAYPALGDRSAGMIPVEYFYGRTRYSFDLNRGLEVFSTLDGAFSAMSVGIDMDRPVWWRWEDERAGRRVPNVNSGGLSVTTVINICYPAGCPGLFQVQVTDHKSTSLNGAGFYDCPDRGSPVGCEVLWRQLAGPVIANYRAHRAQFEAEGASWRAELVQLNAARDARFAGLDAASGEAFSRSQAAGQAEAGKAERDFTVLLGSANAGRLFTMADEFEGAGDIDKARQTLRTLINRFPDHGLAVTAAQRLSALPPSQASAGNCAAAAQEAQLGQSLRGAMSRIPQDNLVWQYEAILATIERTAAAWNRCPNHPSSAAKLRTYRAAYIETARRCGMISPSGACTPNMH